MVHRRAEVGGGHGGGLFREAAINGHGRQGEGFPHGGAGSVEPVKGHAEFPQTEGGTDALVQQVPGENIIQVSGL